MCMSRLHQVTAAADGGRVAVHDFDGTAHVLSTLAYEGPSLQAGDWIVAHSGFALCPADAEDVAIARADMEQMGVARVDHGGIGYRREGTEAT